ncbi:hypothetical protein [Deinococcus sp.]|uniref:hypothetical protein n=1 Tax=Deinococcus sp. TaxID=47478 RepID=UPI0025FBD362|nr:hypothetical protein [Deinococcus sp.]
MKRFLLILPLILASCVPALQKTQGTASALKFDAAGLTFVNGDTEAALKVIIAIDGGATTDSRCEAPREGIRVCRLGDVPANSAAAVIALTGPLVDANATWRTPAGKLRVIVAGK